MSAGKTMAGIGQHVEPRRRPPGTAPVSITVRRFEPGDAPAVARLNERFASQGIADRVWPESNTTPSELRGDPYTQELYVAADGAEVRGGVWLHEHEFALGGGLLRAGWLKYPVAESLIDREYGGVPGAMLVSVLRRQRLLMALGMGGRDTPFARILAALGWTLIDVPFYVAPVRPARALRHIPSGRKRLASLLAFSGIATAAAAPVNALRAATSAMQLRGVTVSEVATFGAWADDVWEQARDSYGFIGRRDAVKLNAFYDTDYWKLTRLRIQRDRTDIGWACVTFPRIWGANAEPGDSLRMGMIADALARPADAATILAAATRYLVRQGMDVIVTNQLHAAWRKSLPFLGYARRPSNFVLACSKQMSARLAPHLVAGDVYVNRGDCDGPPP